MNKYQIPAGPSIPKSFLRSFEMVKEPIRVITENMAVYGDTYAVKAGIDKYIIVTQDPGFIEHVLKKNHKNYAKSNIASEKLGRFLGKGLLTSNGEYWLRQRRLIQPGFHRQKIQNLYEVMQNTIDEGDTTLFQASIDSKKINRRTRKCKVFMSEVPANVTIMEIEPREVEILIFKNQ